MTRNDQRQSSPCPQVLVVDDEPDIRELLDLTLARMGLRAECVGTLAQAYAALDKGSFQLCITDMRLPDGEGIELVRHIGTLCADIPVAVITAFGSADSAVAALKAGAFDYVSKPVSLEQLRGLVKSALDLEVDARHGPTGDEPQLLGEAPAMQQARALIDRVARSQAPVHITGESGTGKELAARRIHALGGRAKGPFIPVNCGAIPETLMESEFFGYRKGAFTGADSDRDGFFQVASGGTLFLDEVADLPLNVQVKLLRAIQEKRVRKVGAAVEDPVDIRLICATHRDLRSMVEQGKFRQDLFYRINVIELRMPPLRECRDDIPLLAHTIAARLHSGDTPAAALTDSALAALQNYPFPGNVRELENVIERALALMTGPHIDADDLGLNLIPEVGADGTAAVASLQDHLDAVECKAISEALVRCNGNRTAAAKILGISFRSMRYRMARLGMRD
ncbi:MAG: sigma-54-dependent Fis family transcriptional regulator [Rhodocyclaceae bacterium]|jgi:two-component system response regulator PilR (NtrC family)|nr:sigma-54-dependent Fis family transcriptional regulator [Rhodocyclaceae bacterium]MBK6908197.1 sigma-54-dependent Fis family transcriptional regulator [Rhodocyclaceae bacterium]